MSDGWTIRYLADDMTIRLFQPKELWPWEERPMYAVYMDDLFIDAWPTLEEAEALEGSSIN